MKGALLMTGEEFFTDMKRMAQGIKNPEKFNWLITDFEGDPQSPKLEAQLNPPSGYWFGNGEDFMKLVTKKRFQWEWAMITGFDPSVKLDEIIPFGLPNTNVESFFEDRVAMQHPRAKVEMICYDSTMFIFIAESYAMVKYFREKFPESVDLREYNLGNA